MTFVSVKNVDNEEIVFTKEDGTEYRLLHIQDCCESVSVEDVEGDLSDLENTPILFAEESTNDDPKDDEALWTFYRIRTIKGSVVIRWYGSSYYYSVSVSFVGGD